MLRTLFNKLFNREKEFIPLGKAIKIFHEEYPDLTEEEAKNIVIKAIKSGELPLYGRPVKNDKE